MNRQGYRVFFSVCFYLCISYISFTLDLLLLLSFRSKYVGVLLVRKINIIFSLIHERNIESIYLAGQFFRFLHKTLILVQNTNILLISFKCKRSENGTIFLLDIHTVKKGKLTRDNRCCFLVM